MMVQFMTVFPCIITFPTAWQRLPDLAMSMYMYKWAPASCSGPAAFHLAACVCTSSSDKGLIGAVKACVLTHAFYWLFHNRLTLHHLAISQEVINTESWSTFQILGICSAESRYSFVFLPICWENTFFRQKLINMAVVTEQTTEAFDWKLIGFM